MTIANQLTLARLLVTPVIAALAYWPSPACRAWALALFLLAMLTDVLDGIIARLPGQSSRLGLYLDPVADKVILVTLFIVLADLGYLPMWIALLMMAREMLVEGLRSAAATTGQVIGANWMGKTKAVVQTLCIAVALALMAWEAEEKLARQFITLLALATLVLAWAFAAMFLWWNRALLRQAS
ncbi:MAG TPA: CDP-diacylglycerol--glycerol-3-phosphate 3-phosphatidyltransferase [Planctomycetaceae bacterium]|nr:CDP-diacylglycerol--glycerol-3-phosphate 3-phosphatidyltransferase [Planctomycetaceae bacterium]